MPTQRKIFTVQNLTEKLKDTKALVLADYRGLTVSQMAELREAVKDSGGEMEVIKNRLLNIAAKEAKVEIDDQALTGPTVVLWAWEDEISPLKVLYQFSQKAGLPKIKYGLFNQEVLPLEQIKVLAQLPEPEILKTKLVGQLAAPFYGLTGSLRSNLFKLIIILKQKAEGGDH